MVIIAPRLGEFGYEKQDDAVGIILLRTGEKTQDVLKRVEAEDQRELNDQILPKDVKVVPFYDRTDLIHLTTKVVGINLVRGMLIVLVILIFPLRLPGGLDRRHHHPAVAAIRVSLSRSSKRLGQPAVIRAIDFGILVDGAIFMVENIFRQIALRKGTSLNVMEIIKDAAAEVDRPLFYAVR